MHRNLNFLEDFNPGAHRNFQPAVVGVGLAKIGIGEDHSINDDLVVVAWDSPPMDVRIRWCFAIRKVHVARPVEQCRTKGLPDCLFVAADKRQKVKHFSVSQPCKVTGMPFELDYSQANPTLVWREAGSPVGGFIQKKGFMVVI